MADSAGINPLISFIFTGIGGLIGYMTAVKVSDRKEFQKVAIEFQDVLFDVLLEVDPKHRVLEGSLDLDIYEIVKKHIPTQIKTMRKFRLYLPNDKRDSFDKAWNEYCYDKADRSQSFFPYPYPLQYAGDEYKGQSTKETVVERINNLLKFVELAHKSPFESNGI